MEKQIISYGQHFLINNDYIQKFIRSAKLNKTDIVLEIGSGTGIITKELVKHAAFVNSVEIDTSLVNALNQISKQYSNVNFIFDNCLNFEYPPFNKLVSSLPYQITEPFVEKIKKYNFKFAVLIVGDTFAKNATGNLNDINKLSLLTHCYFEGQYLFQIEPAAFCPAPKTYSACIKLTPATKESLKMEYKIMRELFEQRDKKVKNALIEAIIRTTLSETTKRMAKEIINQYFVNSKLDEYLDAYDNPKYAELFKEILIYVKSLPVT